jgi:hypothetical protein
MVREIWHVGSNPTLSASGRPETRMDTNYAGFVFGAVLPPVLPGFFGQRDKWVDRLVGYPTLPPLDPMSLESASP